MALPALLEDINYKLDHCLKDSDKEDFKRSLLDELKSTFPNLFHKLSNNDNIELSFSEKYTMYNLAKNYWQNMGTAFRKRLGSEFLQHCSNFMFTVERFNLHNINEKLKGLDQHSKLVVKNLNEVIGMLNEFIDEHLGFGVQELYFEDDEDEVLAEKERKKIIRRQFRKRTAASQSKSAKHLTKKSSNRSVPNLSPRASSKKTTIVDNDYDDRDSDTNSEAEAQFSSSKDQDKRLNSALTNESFFETESDCASLRSAIRDPNFLITLNQKVNARNYIHIPSKNTLDLTNLTTVFPNPGPPLIQILELFAQARKKFDPKLLQQEIDQKVDQLYYSYARHMKSNYYHGDSSRIKNDQRDTWFVSSNKYFHIMLQFLAEDLDFHLVLFVTSYKDATHRTLEMYKEINRAGSMQLCLLRDPSYKSRNFRTDDLIERSSDIFEFCALIPREMDCDSENDYDLSSDECEKKSISSNHQRHDEVDVDEFLDLVDDS